MLNNGDLSNEQERIRVLRAYSILDTPAECEFDNLAKLAALICNVPMAIITLMDEKRQWFKSAVGLDSHVREVSRESTFSEYTILGDSVFEVPDALQDERFADQQGIVSAPFIRFYAGAPLVDHDGFKLGAVSVYGLEAKSLTPEQKEGLLTVAKEVMVHLWMRKKDADIKAEAKHLMRMSFIASKINNAIVLNDVNNRVTWVNAAFEKITGYTLEEVKGQRLGDLLSGQDTDYSTVEQARAFTKQKQSFKVDVLAYRKDQTPIWLSVYNTLLFDEHGEADLEVEIIIDITDKKNAEREILEAKEQALSLSATKEMFLSVMSHEIRTPLNAVIGMTHLLLDNDPKPSQLEDLNILKFSGENLLDIINDVLDFSKIETGNLQLESVPFSIKALATDIVTSLQVTLAKNSNQLNLIYDDQIPEEVLGDKTRLYQVLMNFLGNAIKFTHDGTVTLKIRQDHADEQQVRIYFEVADTGIGIAEDKLSYIFEAFTQARTDISRKYGGTGLGLAITKRLLKLYGSDVEIQSKEGEGSTFSFSISFPRVLKLSEVSKETGLPTAFLGKRILIVDDNEINILIATRIFSKWGLEIDSTPDGITAIEKVKETLYDLIFMDVNMPGMDGFEATRIIRGLPGDYFKKIPIIALTASRLSNEHHQFKTAGMNGHVLKPFNPEEIKKMLAGYLK